MATRTRKTATPTAALAPPPPEDGEAAPRRRRRSPEEARALILDAAEGLFAERGPDAVSVLDVAVAAGVSHSLVLHYFKTYAELVRSVLARRNKLAFQEVKRRLLEGANSDDGAAQSEELLGAFLQIVCEPTHARLLAWAALSGEGQHLKMVKNQGLAKVVDLTCAQLAARRGRRPRQSAPAPLPRERVEEAVLVALAAMHGYSTGKSVYAPALGHTDADGLDPRFRRALGAMLRSYLGEPAE